MTEHPNPYRSNSIIPLMEAETRKGQIPIALLIKLVAPTKKRAATNDDPHRELLMSKPYSK